MMLDRRAVMAAVPAFLAGAARAEEILPPLAAYERASGGRIGLYAANLVTGANLAWRADERFVMCSTFKASLAACVLARADRGEERLDQVVPFGAADLQDYAPVARRNLGRGGLSVAELCAGAVSFSDNTCANLLLARVGGPAALTAFWRSVGDEVSRLDHEEPLLNRSPPGDPHDTTTPAAMAQTLRRLVLGEALSRPSRERLTGWMIDCRTGTRLLRAGLPHGWRAGDKTGNNGRDARGDIAVAWPQPDRPVVVCLYAQGGAPTDAMAEATFSETGRLVGRRLA